MTYSCETRFSSCTLTKRAFCKRWNECKSKYGKSAISLKSNIKQIHKTVKHYHSSHYIKRSIKEICKKCKVKAILPTITHFLSNSSFSFYYGKH